MANTKITSRVLADNAVLTANITDANVTTAKVADNAVTGDKVADDVALAGNPTTTTQSAGNNTTRIATTAFVSTAVANLADSAPDALNTLNELAAAMGDDANFSTTITNSIAAKLPLAGGTMTGNIVMGDDTSIGIADDAERIEFDGAGDISLLGANVGIGTTSPRGVLDLGSGSGDGTLDNTPANYQLILEAAQSTTGDIGRNIAFVNSTNDVSAAINSVDGGAGLTQDLMFAVAASGTLSEIMRLDAAGNVGIGVTDPDGELHVESAGNADVYVERTSGAKIHLQAQSALGAIGTNSNHDLGLMTNASVRMRIDNTGRVGINRTPAIANSKLEVGGADNQPLINVEASGATAGFGIGSGNLSFFNGTSAVGKLALSTGTLQMTSGAVASPSYSFIGDTDTGMSRPTANAINFVNGGSESARFDSSRRFMIGLSAAGDGGYLSVLSNGGEGIFNGIESTNAYRRYYHTVSDGIHRFKGSANTATITNAGAWQDASDIAYKEDIQDISYGLDAVKALRPRKYKMKGTDLGDGKGLDQKIGFIAQEAELVVPEVVDGEDGEKTLGYGQLTAVLTKAIQELSAKLEAAEARIKTLEES